MANTDPLRAIGALRPLPGFPNLPWVDVRLLVVGAVVVAVLVPVLVVSHPSGIDWPNHLARHAIGHDIAASPVLQQFYTYVPRLVANSGADLLIGLLAPLWGVEAAARGVLLLSLALWVVAPLALSRALHGRWLLWPLLAAPFAWNMNIAMGFENYSLAAPLAVLSFALWVGWGHLRAGVVAFVALSVAVYLGHIIAFGLLAMMIGLWEAPTLLHRRHAEPRAVLLRTVGLALLFGVPIIYFVSALHGNLPAEERLTSWGTLPLRLRAVLAPALALPNPGMAALTVMGVLGIVASLLMRGWLVLHPRMGAVLAGLAVVALFAPSKTLGIAFTDIRISPVAMLVFVAAFRFKGPRNAGRFVSAVCVALLATTLVPLARSWKAHDAQVASLREGFALIEPGAKVLRSVPLSDWTLATSPLTHAIGYAVLDRQAFVPALFSSGQFLSVQPSHAALDHPVPRPIPMGLMADPAPAAAPYDYWHGWPETFDYVLLTGRLDDPSIVPPGIAPIHSGPVHTLFRILRPAQTASGEGVRS